MAPKRAKLYSYGDDARCDEVRKFIEDAGILLDIHDMSEKPLSRAELSDLIGNLNIEHFINNLSDSYAKNNLGEGRPDREKVLDLMAEDHTLIRRPIVVSSRLLTIGCDKRKIADMLQINASDNGDSKNAKSARSGKGDSGEGRGNRRYSQAAR